MLLLRASAVALALTTFACSSSDDVTCGPGTSLRGTQCVVGGGDDGPSDGTCASNADCGDGLCEIASLECVPTSAVQCGMPAAGTASTKLPAGFSCTDNSGCSASMTCVPDQQHRIPQDMESYVSTGGRCMPACDPCDPTTCSAGEECLPLGGGAPGGICQLGGLRYDGEWCGDGLCARGNCKASTGNGGAALCVSPLCVPSDLPSAFADVATGGEIGRAHPSDDCVTGQVCAYEDGGYLLQAGTGLAFACTPGHLVGAGEACNTVDAWCSVGPCNPGFAICYPACSANSPCPAGQTCSTPDSIGAGSVCVPDGSRGPNESCLTDANCASGACNPGLEFCE